MQGPQRPCIFYLRHVINLAKFVRYIFYIPILILLYSTCEHREPKVVLDYYVPAHSSHQLQQRLSRYYDLNNRDSLENLLLQWRNQIKPSRADFVRQNDTLENLFQIFTDLYQPFKFGNHRTENYFLGNSNCVVIQNEIKYDVVSEQEYQRLVYNSSEGYPYDTAYEFYKPARTLLNFRPQVSLGNVKCVYLTTEYKQALNDFLGLGSFNGDIIHNDTIFKRYNFISATLPIVYGHWGGYWHLETFPIIERILFAPDFEHAAVDFRYGLEETMLQYRIVKKNGHWQPENKWLKIRLE